MADHELTFESQTITARFIDPSGEFVEKEIEIRTHPISGRTCRVAFSRINEKDPGNETLPAPPSDRDLREDCPFCQPQVVSKTPQMRRELAPEGRLFEGDSILFPNLFPYGSYSAVSLFSDDHFVEIGTASLSSYTDSFVNCRSYLAKVRQHDTTARYMAITQNHLPSAGGSLLHPHLQINADRIASNHHRFLLQRANEFYEQHRSHLFSTYLTHERDEGRRYIGRTGNWEWAAAFAPEGFFEIWGILPGVFSLLEVDTTAWQELARGVLNIQRYYRSIGRNGYNLGLLCDASPSSRLELRTVILVRSNYAPWARNDITGFEVMLGDMTTFTAPEQTAAGAGAFFK